MKHDSAEQGNIIPLLYTHKIHKYIIVGIFMKIKEILSESPIVDYEPLGNFNKPGSFNDPRDKKLIQNPKHEQKLLQFFQNTHEDFRIFPVNIPGFRQFTETGVVSDVWLRDVFDNIAKRPDIADRILEGHDDHITIVYVSNTGVGKVVMTPWIMAHRFGHAIQAEQRTRNKMYSWKQAEEYFFDEIHEVLRDVYNINIPDRQKYNRRYFPYYTALFNVIGTQRSSRQGLITRPYEFLYELFAQYLQTGTIKLNPLPRSLPYGKSVYGRKSNLIASQDYSDNDLETELISLINTMEYAFGDVLSESVGKIFVM